MKAQLNKETEKAIQITYCCEIYGEQFTVKNVWMPKSQVEIQSNEKNIIEFTPKNDWILDAKTKEYCQYVANTFSHVTTEISTYLSKINSYKVDFCWI